jgi:hypothetical protein
MVQFFKGETEGFNQKLVSYNLIKQSIPSGSLAIMLPGKGYSVQAPLFNYSTGVYLNKGFDVLHVNYDYNTKEFDGLDREQQFRRIYADVHSVIDKVLSDYTVYEHFVLIGKSLGTIALSPIIGRLEFSKAKVVWLTPLLQIDEVFDSLLASSQQGLCVIGNKDFCYIPERYEQLGSKTNMKSMLVPGADHSLNDADKPIESIDILKNIISAISEI